MLNIDSYKISSVWGQKLMQHICIAHARCRVTYPNLMNKDNKLIVCHKDNKRHCAYIFKLIIQHYINNFEGKNDFY